MTDWKDMLNLAVILQVFVSSHCKFFIFFFQLIYFQERNIHVIVCVFFFPFSYTVLHEDGKMFWDCEFSGCTSKTVTKVVDGVMMIKNIQPIHSSECVKDQAERKLSKSGNEANPDEGKILTLVKGSTKAHGLLVWQSDDSGDDSSIECDDDSDSHSSEEWSTTDDDETDDQIENNGEDFNEIITNECLALFSDESDSSVDILLP